MSNLIEIQTQINNLQKQATEIRTRDFSETIKKIQETMTLFGITIKDLELTVKVKTLKAAKATPEDAKKHKETTSVAKKSSSEAKAVRKPVEAKYSGAEGQLWTGRGMTPKWLMTELEKGAKKEDFLIHKASAAHKTSIAAQHNVAHHVESHKESDAAHHVESNAQLHETVDAAEAAHEST